jgi:acetate kinase
LEVDVVSLILSLNCGSSSLKFGVYDATGSKDPELLCEGEAEEIGGDSASFWIETSGKKEQDQARCANHGEALAHALKLLDKRGFRNFGVVGHRIVHGGPQVREHRQLDDETLGRLRDAVDFAPLHLPASLRVIDAVETQMPKSKQVICLDTAFHRHMPDVAKDLALPRGLRDMGIERYGFHGLSLESILHELKIVPARLVVAHLGNGSSVTAILNGKSIDTTMGLTPTGGVMMGTRTGDLDPGVMLFLMRKGYGDPAKLENLVDKKSGLAGVSGIGSDVRELMSARPNANAELALHMFCYRVRKAIAAMAGALGGLDLLVFTGGIGEHAEKFVDAFEIRVLPSQEDLQIARITQQIVGAT